MKTIQKIFGSLTGDPGQDPFGYVTNALLCLLIMICTGLLFYAIFHSTASFAAGSTASLPPGDDSAAGKLQAAGTLLKILDTGIFKWGARVFAGLCIMSSAWALKEQRFGIAIICVIGAIIFGTATKWVQNVFSIGGSDSIFQNDSSENVEKPLLSPPVLKTASFLSGSPRREGSIHG